MPIGSMWVHVCVSDESLKSDLRVDSCVSLGVLKLPQITSCYYQCWANRRQFAFGWWAILKVSAWCFWRRGIFFSSITYAYVCRMKEGNGMRWFKKAGEKKRVGWVITFAWGREGWRWAGTEMRWRKENALRMVEEHSCTDEANQNKFLSSGTDFRNMTCYEWPHVISNHE